VKRLFAAFVAKRSRGVAAVEFALILPVFLTILFGSIDFGWLFFNQLASQSAAREGGRAAALSAADGSCTSDATTAARAFLNANGLPGNGASVSAAVAGTPKVVTVTVTMNFTPIVGVLFLPSGSQPFPSSLSGTAVMRREN
jgi:Flp pilus assembly protein TadG